MSEIPARRPLPEASRWAWPAFAAALLAVSTVALVVAGVFARSIALQSLAESGRSEASLKLALLQAVLERPRAVPLLLSLDRDVQDALTRPTPDNRSLLNRKLEQLVTATNASVLYAIDTSGVTIAASNWRLPDSFVGSDYSFRPYFQSAMANGSAEHFALGSVSRRPGLYISQRVGSPNAPSGVVVTKTEFGRLEAEWTEADRPVYVVDEQGVVLISSISEWRFRTLEPLSDDVAETIRDSLQFGEAPLTPLPVTELRPLPSDTLSDPASDIPATVAIVSAPVSGRPVGTYLRISLPVESTPWRLDYLMPIDASLAAAEREARLVTLLALVPLAGIAAVWLYRRRLALARMAAVEDDRRRLERRVEERTFDLTRARDSLQAEIAEHEETEKRLLGVQQELVQANRLAILGQVAAGVAHEINQPVATIRAYADNARTFLARGQQESAVGNLVEIAGLTQRIGAITEDLKALSRKGRAAAGPVSLREVLDGATMLLKSRFASGLAALRIEHPSPDVVVHGNRLRLEQVFINLFQNALEAIEQRAGGRVTVTVASSAGEVVVSVEDNGGGIAPEIMGTLFTPFTSSKEKGLGLGLVIARDIVRDYEGRIEVRTDTEGTRFTVHLRKAGEAGHE